MKIVTILIEKWIIGRTGSESLKKVSTLIEPYSISTYKKEKSKYK